MQNNSNSFWATVLGGILVTVIGGVILANLVGGDASSPVQNVPSASSNNITQQLPTQVTTSFTPAPSFTPTPSGIYNPSGRIDAGQPIIVDGYQLYVDSNSYQLVQSGGTFLTIKLAVKNLGDNQKVFRYAPNSITIKDDTGKIYEHIVQRGCEGTSGYVDTKSLSIQAGSSVTIQPASLSSSFWWCLEGMNEYIPYYDGNISAGAKYLIYEFNGFGPFSGFEIWIEL